MCRNNGPASLTKINKTATKGASRPILLRLSRKRTRDDSGPECALVASSCVVTPLAWSGQYEYRERATAWLKLRLPITLMIIFVRLWLTLKRISDVLMAMGTLPFSLTGGGWLLWLLEYNLSVAGAVDFIARAGVLAEFGIIMVLYFNQALDFDNANKLFMKAIHEGVVLRVRPKVMAVATLMAGLLPGMWGGDRAVRRGYSVLLGR